MRADRLLSAMSLLRTHERLSAADLARRLEVTPRTVMRDMDALSAAGVPVYATRGRDGGFSLLPGFRPHTDGLTSEEAEAFFAAGAPEVAQALGLGEPFARALRKLADHLPATEARAVSRTGRRIVVDPAGWSGEAPDEGPLVELFDAVLQERRLQMDYVARDATAPKERIIDPWGVVLADRTWYLIAARDGEARTYRVSRIKRLAVLDEPATIPAELDLLAVWQRLRARFSEQPSIRIRLRMLPSRWDLTQRLLAMARHGDATIEPEGEQIVVTVGVSSLRGAAGCILGMGNWIEVLDPPELRTVMKDLTNELAVLYADVAPGPVAGET